MNCRSAIMAPWGFPGSPAKPLYKGENVVGGLHLATWPWIRVAGGDGGGNVGLQFGEPALDLVDPGCGGRRDMHMPMRVARPSHALILGVPWVAFSGKPVHRTGSRSASLVHDDMHFGAIGHPPVDLLQDVRKLARAMAPMALSSAAKSDAVPPRTWLRVLHSAVPGASDKTGCSRSGARIRDFSSTHGTMARFGGDR